MALSLKLKLSTFQRLKILLKYIFSFFDLVCVSCYDFDLVNPYVYVQ